MSLSYPPARRGDDVDDFHGTSVADPYRWLEDSDAPETRTWIEAQNRLAEKWLAEVSQRPQISARLRSLIDHPRAGAPWRRGNRWFQLRNSGLQNQDVLWTMAAPEDQGEVLLDPNLLSSDGTLSLSAVALTEDGGLLAYATSAAGSDWLTWQVRDVETGQELGDRIAWSKFSGAAWAPDNSGFFYAAYDEPDPDTAYEQINRDQRLLFHRLGTPQSDDQVIYARPDQPEWGFSPLVTADGRFVVIDVWHGTQPNNRVYLIDLENDPERVIPLLDDFDAGYAYAGNDGRTLLFRTDLDAPLGRVLAIDVDDPRRDGWREVVPEGGATLERARIIGGRLLTVELHDATHRLRWYRLDGTPDGQITLPGLGAVDAITGRPDDDLACFTFATFTAPTSVYRYDTATGETSLLHRPSVGVDPEDLVTEQHFVPSTDGAKVPVFTVRRRDVEPDGNLPVWLYGYGGFQIPVTPRYRSDWLVWLELGGVVAVANLRGGGEYGQDWHDAGRLANKQQVFDDAIAVAQWLIDAGWTRPARLAINGGSNGGLLVGACMTQRPDLFGAAVPEVGVLDMLRFHKFTIGWGWASDYGTPDDPEQFAWLYAYSPLHRIQPGTAYPATLITTGDHDDRVVPAHSFKFVAALQAAQGGEAPVLIRIETDAGHGAGKPTDKVVAERSDVVAFLVRALAVDSKVEG